jgi:hypothetical protein
MSMGNKIPFDLNIIITNGDPIHPINNWF